MKFGVGVPVLTLYPPAVAPWEARAGFQEILRLAQAADELGFDFLASDHIVLPPEMAQVLGPRYPESLTANLGDGWIPWLITAQQLPACRSYIREQPGFRERPRPFEVFMPLASHQAHDYARRRTVRAHIPVGWDEIMERVAALQEAGTGAWNGWPSLPRRWVPAFRG